MPPSVSEFPHGTDGPLLKHKIGNPGGIRTRNNPIESRVPWPVRRQGLLKMAERRGHAPHATRWQHDLVSTESRLAGPVGVP